MSLPAREAARRRRQPDLEPKSLGSHRVRDAEEAEADRATTGGVVLGQARADAVIHKDAPADQLARSVGADAVTFGKDIYFAAGRFRPGTSAGDSLLAHELAHVVQQRDSPRLRRQEAKPTTAAKQLALLGLDNWEQAGGREVARYRIWLTRNLGRFLGDLLSSEKGEAVFSKIKGGFAEGVLNEAVGNIVSSGAISLAGKYGGQKLIRLFFELRHAKVLGGIIGFIAGSIIESVVGDLLDRTNEVIRTTAGQVVAYITNVVNPRADERQQQLTLMVQEIRRGLSAAELSEAEWAAYAHQFDEGTRMANAAMLALDDLSLYRQLALMADVYSGASIAAENHPPIAGPRTGKHFTFSMQHAQVETKNTEIVVASDGANLLIECEAHHCLRDEDGEFYQVDVNGPDASPSWKGMKSTYYVELVSDRLIGTQTHGPSREFSEGMRQYAAWYGLSRGTYWLRIARGYTHIVALCGDGEVSVSYK